MFILNSNCYVYKRGSWNTGPAMVHAKYGFAMSKSPFTNKPQSLFATGGNGLTGVMSTAEILTENGWEEFSPSLPVTITQHCMLLINSTTAMVVGGNQNSSVSANTYLISNDKKVKYDYFLLKVLRMYNLLN